MRIWSLLELAGFGLITYGVWLLSPGWGYVVGGFLLALWAAIEELRRTP